MDVDRIIEIIRKYFPTLEKPDELCLDAEAVHSIASVIRLQSEWLQRRSTSLYLDPLIIEKRIKDLSRDDLAFSFLTSWRPIIEQETLTIEALKEALEYWYVLPPLRERWGQLTGNGTIAGSIDRPELFGLHLADTKTFEEKLQELHDELRKGSKRRRVPYWDFVTTSDYQKTVERSYLASFMISYGWASLEIDPIGGEAYVEAKPRVPLKRIESVPRSVVLSLSKDEWARRATSD